MLAIAAVGMGCSDDDPIAKPAKGTITVSPEPDVIDAPWQLTGTAGFSHSGAGSASLFDMSAGSYTLTWGEVAGWTTPSPDAETQTLEEGGALTFAGAYVPTGFESIPPGTFMMGSPEDEPARDTDENRHEVTLSRGFYMSRYEVTEAWWHQVMGGTTANPDAPKVNVSWDAAVQFCNTLSIQEGLTPAYTIHGANGDVTWNQDAAGYRLPTEAEWEYACRAGSTTAFANGPTTNLDCDPLDPNLDAMGRYCGNCGGWHRLVGQKLANAWGLYDMHGNVSEWVWDGYRTDCENLPPVDAVHDGVPGGVRVLRGGSWGDVAHCCRSAGRFYYAPTLECAGLGFRPVRSVP